MNFTCNECNDSGSRDKLGTYLDCNACGTAAIRRDLNDFVKSLGPLHPEDVALAIHQRALAMAPKQEAPKPVAWRYEWASCITCDGPQNFKLNFDIEPPPAWAVHDGQARNVVQLFAAPAAANGAPELPPPFFYYESNEDGSVEWNEGCVCQDDVYTNAEYAKENGTHGGKVYSEAQMRAALSGAKRN